MKDMASMKTAVIHAVFLLLTWAVIALAFKQDPRNEFYSHAVVHPSLYQTYLARKDSFEGKEDIVQLKFEAFGKNFAVELKENKNLFSPDYKEIADDGNEIVYEKIDEKERRCYYQGRLPNVENSWAAISTCDGISGVISDGKETYYIEPNRMSGNTEHLVFKASDHKYQNLKCGVEGDVFSVQEHFSDNLNIQNLEDPYKSDKDSRFIEAVVINDNSMFRKYNSDKDAVFSRTKQIFNVANSILNRLNTFLTLKSTRVWMQKDWINITSNAHATLDSFLKFRKDSLQKYDANDNGIFITNQRYDGGVVGNAYPSQICTEDMSGENIYDSTDVVGLVGSTLAHEVGHNLGALHDDDGTKCKCADDYCVMYPYLLSNVPTHWSSCSTEAIQKIYSSGQDSCLKNKPTAVEGPSCGNGYLEEGEECDCGIKLFCDDACCNADTCRKVQGDQCS